MDRMTITNDKDNTSSFYITPMTDHHHIWFIRLAFIQAIFASSNDPFLFFETHRATIMPLCLEFAPLDNKANQLASKNMFFRSKFEYCDTKKADVLRPSQIMRGQSGSILTWIKKCSVYMVQWVQGFFFHQYDNNDLTIIAKTNELYEPMTY